MGLIINKLVKEKKVKAPIVIGRDHLDSGSVASPNRETESMKDGSDAIADWVYLNALINEYLFIPYNTYVPACNFTSFFISYLTIFKSA